MEAYVSQVMPDVGETWKADEVYVKFKGDMKHLFAMMDDDTRFWIAQQVSDKKGTSDVRPMFREAEKRAGKRPRVLISDGAPNFARANKKEWYSHHPERNTVHVPDIRLGGQVHNNKMERLNGGDTGQGAELQGPQDRRLPNPEGIPTLPQLRRAARGPRR